MSTSCSSCALAQSSRARTRGELDLRCVPASPRFLRLHVFPTPDLAQPACHVDVRGHVGPDPRVVEKVLWCRALSRVNAQPERQVVSSSLQRRWVEGTYVSRIKSFMASDHVKPSSSSSCGGWNTIVSFYGNIRQGKLQPLASLEEM